MKIPKRLYLPIAIAQAEHEYAVATSRRLNKTDIVYERATKRRARACPVCNGSGDIPVGEIKKVCTNCRGSVKILPVPKYFNPKKRS